MLLLLPLSSSPFHCCLEFQSDFFPGVVAATMTESSLTIHTKAPFSRRTKKTVPKPPMELIPHDVEEEEMLRDLYKRLVYSYTQGISQYAIH